MAPTGKVTPSGKCNKMEAFEPECLQSQAVCTCFFQTLPKNLQTHTSGIKNKQTKTKQRKQIEK